MNTAGPTTGHLIRLACTAVLVLTGCGQTPAPTGSTSDRPDDQVTSDPDDTVSSDVPGPGGDPDVVPGFEPTVHWNGTAFEVLAFGSSSCPPTASAVDVADDGTVVIDVGWEGDPDTACTDDYGPSTSTIEAPPGLGRPVTVRLRQDGRLGRPLEVTDKGSTSG